ncbi:hypothetical protein TNCV_723571 [Trichonephila clavipes]|nr:hypothetical protein TNCV_723571 [Trichonephila clavipes]
MTLLDYHQLLPTGIVTHLNQQYFPVLLDSNYYVKEFNGETFFLQLFEIRFASWDVKDMVLGIEVSVSTLGHVSAEHSLEPDERGCGQLTHLCSRLQSEEACPTDAHLEHVNCPLHAV